MISQNIKEYILEHPELQDYLDEDDTSDAFFVEKEKVAKQLTPDEILTMMVLFKNSFGLFLVELNEKEKEIEELLERLEERDEMEANT